ncbi:receptor-type tyrosine-protein phosphatase kappa-like [Mya arenaria]|nr:receptor-type tyrosine-protein phosphatase kappa-like [Mya arenaria]XP_052763017.1 receptor-type tyrosine-protein phosphatase kappa-like [Mya arenaria]XP_052763018.1 receptor-type tyrosine-protein phosphatase kappa-like [Mya arenaria]XP_052763019.1 receptor-type tyrosine-protein phosphatase kappa-like [Mya arenaria]
MIIQIFAVLFVAQTCMAATAIIDGKEVDCGPRCVCCKGGADNCQPNDFCSQGCVDTIYGQRCLNPCPGNCSTCSQETGIPCYTCNVTFYDLNTKCSKKCPVSCEGGVCNDYGACESCIGNFEGTKCDTCKQGFTGPSCTACSSGYYGPDCEICPSGCKYQNCMNNGTCFQCIDNFYGMYCDLPCSVGCKSGNCKQDGSCTCKEHFNGSKCETCIEGKYGNDCQQTCSEGCVTSTCDRNTGFCVCRPYFTGATCEQCNEGSYGKYCDLHCSSNCNTRICSRNNGKCTSCVDGYSGDNCTTVCDSRCATCKQSDKSVCLSCLNEHTGPTCSCPPNCYCSGDSDFCSYCNNQWKNSDYQCKCHAKYCHVDDCNKCLNNTFFVDSSVSACCECPANCKGGSCTTGPRCTVGCKDGFYGTNCSLRCTTMNVECEKCSQVDGKCLKCKDGHYPHVNGSCVKCNNKCRDMLCSSENGTCLSGCTGKVWGDKCESQCNPNCETCLQDSGICDTCTDNTFYGSYCNKSCSLSCSESKCDQNSHCLFGCKGDFFGDQCQTNCPHNCQKSGTETICKSDGNCKFGCVDGYEGDDCTIKEEKVTAGPPVGAIAGGVSGGIVVIIAVAVALVFFRRRSTRLPASRQTKGNGNKTFQANITDERNKETQDRTYYNEGQVKRESTKPIPTISRPPANKPNAAKQQVSAHEETAFESEIDLEIDNESNGALGNFSKDDQTYYNELGPSTNKSKVHINQLLKYVDGKTHDAFSAEFEKFSLGLVKPYVESQKRENMTKNRYKGIYPYDDSRVKVTGSGGSDYINASFIDGYKKPKQYIATLGPMSQQLDDFSLFWKMIWQQRVEKVVMVTNLIEHGSPKCEQYWPNPGASRMYGEIKVESRSEDEYAEFTRRALTMTMGTEERTLHHLHFTCWPDKAIPDDVTAMIEFRQRVQSTPSTLNGPTVVHCSAGVGRTGTYIALDILTKEGEAERAIDIAGCVHKMRLNRPNMVQTVEQYQFLHTAVVYSLTFDCKQIKGENFDQFMKQHTSQELNSQFKRLQHTVEKRTKDEAIAVERNKQHLSKNRANADIPGNENRPRLYLNLKHGASDYINAVYIHSFRIKKRYLVAQTPLPETVIDFLTLVVQESCSCIVSFEADMDKQRNIGIYYPAANQEVLKQGTFQVSCSREEKKTFYAERTLKIQHKGVGTSTERTIPHLQFTDWDETNNIPRSTTNFLSFLNVIENVTKQSGDGPILVHCLDGAGKSGLFCVVSLLLHKMAVEHEVSVLNSVRKIKTMRRLAIPNQEQFSFCHGCVSEYLSSFDVYANFNEETGRL